MLARSSERIFNSMRYPGLLLLICCYNDNNIVYYYALLSSSLEKNVLDASKYASKCLKIQKLNASKCLYMPLDASKYDANKL